MIHIYAEHITPRLEYVAAHIFDEILGIDFKFVNLESEIHINYSRTEIEHTFQIFPHGLLEEKGIHPHPIDIGDWNHLPVFFRQDYGDIPFDLFSSAFYLLSRYEEYGNLAFDEHGRFMCENSAAFQHNFLHLPIVDLWANLLKELLLQHFNSLIFTPPRYRFVSTIDIDNLYAYKHKGLVKNLLLGIKNVLQRDFKNLLKQVRVIMRKAEDPFYTFDWISQLHEKRQLNPIYFVHAGPMGKYDKKTLYRGRKFRKFLKKSINKASFGLHISYKASFDNQRQQKEKKRLEKLLGEKVFLNRYHYLRFSLPESYRLLLSLGITADYSMGYASHIGFRAGTSFPFYFYDLENEEQTPLKIHALPVMDVTLRNAEKYNPAEAIEITKKLAQTVKDVGGEFVLLWHNQNLSYIDGWASWKAVYDRLLFDLNS